jgi:hypothetical protein
MFITIYSGTCISSNPAAPNDIQGTTLIEGDGLTTKHVSREMYVKIMKWFADGKNEDVYIDQDHQHEKVNLKVGLMNEAFQFGKIDLVETVKINVLCDEIDEYANREENQMTIGMLKKMTGGDVLYARDLFDPTTDPSVMEEIEKIRGQV